MPDADPQLDTVADQAPSTRKRRRPRPCGIVSIRDSEGVAECEERLQGERRQAGLLGDDCDPNATGEGGRGCRQVASGGRLARAVCQSDREDDEGDHTAGYEKGSGVTTREDEDAPVPRPWGCDSEWQGFCRGGRDGVHWNRSEGMGVLLPHRHLGTDPRSGLHEARARGDLGHGREDGQGGHWVEGGNCEEHALVLTKLPHLFNSRCDQEALAEALAEEHRQEMEDTDALLDEIFEDEQEYELRLACIGRRVKAWPVQRNDEVAETISTH